MDMLAEKLKMDPLEFRKLNSLQPGQTKAPPDTLSTSGLSRAFARPSNPRTNAPWPTRPGMTPGLRSSAASAWGRRPSASAFRVTNPPAPWNWNSDDIVTVYGSRPPIPARAMIPCSPNWPPDAIGTDRPKIRLVYPGHGPNARFQLCIREPGPPTCPAAALLLAIEKLKVGDGRSRASIAR